jgi:DNA-binding winged helix-turn-helix (wHTH) protein
MAKNWETQAPTYRAREMKILANWIAAGESGSVVGLAGCGRTNLLEFLCYRPDVLQGYLLSQISPVVLIPIDLNNLPANDPATLYRTILRAFYQMRDRFASIAPAFPQTVTDLYLENRAVQDPFLAQSTLHDLLLLFQEQQVQIVLVLNRFDHFCQLATPQMINTMRGLRDTFKDTLCYLVGMRQEVAYLPDPTALGDLYDLLDSRVCWVGAMEEADARRMIDTIVHPTSTPPPEAEVAAMLALSGCFPILIKAIGDWWLVNPNRPTAATPEGARDDWRDILLAESSIQYRLERIWNGLTQEEQLALAEVQKLQAQARGGKVRGSGVKDIPKRFERAFQALAKRQYYPLTRLAAKGLCYQAGQGWWIAGELLAAFVANVAGRVPGKIVLDEKNKTIYQGEEPVEDLTGLQYEILRFLIKNPRVKHTRDVVIDNAWPENEQREGITPNALQVHIASIRKKIESNPALPRYLITWHGRPGGYQFFPEGKPS